MGLIRKGIQHIVEATAPVKEEYVLKPSSKDVEKSEDETAKGIPEQREKKYDISKPNRIFLKPLRVYKLFADTDFRWRFSLHLSVLWGISTIIVGIIFVCLSATGVYPESVAIQKELGVFVEDLIKYSLYIVAGILALVGAFVARKKLLSSKSTPPYEKIDLVVPQIILVAAVLTALATVAMSIQILVEINNSYPVDGWSWFILVIFVLQRLFLAAACISATWTLNDASNKGECRDILC